jgi:hypothetical protein
VVREEGDSAGVSATEGLGEVIGGRQCRKRRQQFTNRDFEADPRPRVIFCSSIIYTPTPVDYFL